MKTSYLVLASTCAVWGCSKAPPTPQPPPAVLVESVASHPAMTGPVVYSAVVEPVSQVPLAFRGPGYIAQVMRVKASDGRLRAIVEGDRVRQGDVLARLRDAEYREKAEQVAGQLGAARAAAQKAREDYERAGRLFATQSITRSDYEAATAQRDATRAQVATAEAGLAEARVALRDTSLRSPLNGDVVKKTIEPGSFVGPGTLAFVVADVSRVKVVLGVPDVALGSVSVGLPVTILSDALSGRRFEARVSRVASAADPKTRNFEVEVEIPNSQGLWRAGMIASVELSGSSAPGGAPNLPLSSFVEAPGQKGRFAVMVIEGEGETTRARLRPVELGDVTGNRVAVTNGLKEGERVITTGASLLADGERVEVVPSEAR